MTVFAASKKKPTLWIDGYPVDVVLTEEHNLEADITEFETESGSDFNDNIRNKSPAVTVTGVVSNSPLADVLAVRKGINNAGQTDGSFVDEALTTLEAIFEGRFPVSIETSLRTYDSMALESLSIPVDKNMSPAAGITFTATFKKIKVVKNTRASATIRVSVPRGGGKSKPTTPAGWRSQLEIDQLRAKRRPPVVVVDGQWDPQQQAYVDGNGKPVDLKKIEDQSRPKVKLGDYDANGNLKNPVTGDPAAQQPYYTVDYTDDGHGGKIADPRYVIPGQGDTSAWWNPRNQGPETTPLKPPT